MNKQKLAIIDDDWDSRKDVYQTVLNEDFGIYPFNEPANLKNSITNNKVDGYIVDVVLDRWVTDQGNPQELIPILELLKAKELPIILVSRNYDVLLENERLTSTINEIIKKGIPVKSFLTWSEFEKEYRNLKRGIIKQKVQKDIQLWLLAGQEEKKREADIGIICALKSEQTPFLDCVNQEEIERITIKERYFQKGVIETKNGKKVRFVTAIQNQMGTVDAAALGTILAREFNIKHLFMIGVCGGRDEDVKIGDIIIPSFSIAYQKGKITSQGLSREAGYSQTNIDTINIFNNDCKSIITSIYGNYHHKMIREQQTSLETKVPNIHFHPIACGENVVDLEDALDNIALDVAQRKLCAIDMESYAILRLNQFLDIKTVVIKSVMDLAKNKSDKYKEYAAYIAANFLYETIKDEIYKIN